MSLMISQPGGLADWRIGEGADSRNTERPRGQGVCGKKLWVTTWGGKGAAILLTKFLFVSPIRPK